MQISREDIEYAKGEAEQNNFQIFGKREWEAYVVDKLPGFFIILTNSYLWAPEGRESANDNREMLKCLTLVFGTLFSANGNKIPSLERVLLDKIGGRFMEMHAEEESLGSIRRELIKILSSFCGNEGVELANIFFAELILSTLSLHKKLQVCVLVIGLVLTMRYQEDKQAAAEQRRRSAPDPTEIEIGDPPIFSEGRREERRSVRKVKIRPSKPIPSEKKFEFHPQLRRISMSDRKFLRSIGVSWPDDEEYKESEKK